MPPEAPSSQIVAPAPAPVSVSALPSPAPTESSKEDDESRAGSMTLLLPQHQQVLLSQPAMTTTMTGKQADQRLPMPTLQRPRKRLVVKTSSSATSGTTWVLALLAAAAIMAAVAAAAMAMAARAEIFRLRAEVNNVRVRLGYHESLCGLQRTLETGMEPFQEEDEDVVWEQRTTDALAPAYPDGNEFEFAADVKGNFASSRHSRRHIPTVSASYESSENEWRSRPGKSEKRLKLYDALASGTFSPQPAEPTKVSDDAHARHAERFHHRSSGGRLVAAPHQQAQSQRAPPVPVPPVLSAAPAPPSPATEKVVVVRRSRVMEHQTRNDASWRQRNQMHIQHHLQRQLHSSTSKPALLMEFSGKAEETIREKKGGVRNVDAVVAHFNINANRRSKSEPSTTDQPVSWCSASWMSQYGQNEYFSIQNTGTGGSSGSSSVTVRSPGIYYVYAQGDAHGLLLQRNGRRQAWCRAAPGSTCFTASVVALSTGDSVAIRDIDGHLLTNSSASLGFVRLSCPKSYNCDLEK